jgi:hypothetical protein
MAGSRYWWYRWTGPDGKRHAVSTKTDDESEAIVRARAIHVDFTQTVPKNPLVPLIDRYLDEAQSRNKNPMRPETASPVCSVIPIVCATDGGGDAPRTGHLGSTTRF